MVENIMRRKIQENFNMITAFRTDENTQYGVMQDVMNQMRRAEALRVSFEARRRVR
jgi:biopolymer transport protein ExbD